MRLLTDLIPGQGRYDTHLDVNLAVVAPLDGRLSDQGASRSACSGLLAFLCRTKTTDRRDPRLLGEVALVVLTMLFLSERSWKHHYVTVLLPYSYLVCEFFSSRVGPRSRMLLVGSWALSFSLDGGDLAGSGRLVRRRAGARDRPGLWLVPVGGCRAVRDGRLARLGASHLNQPPRPARCSWLVRFPGLISTSHGRLSASCHVLSQEILLIFLIVRLTDCNDSSRVIDRGGPGGLLFELRKGTGRVARRVARRCSSIRPVEDRLTC